MGKPRSTVVLQYRYPNMFDPITKLFSGHVDFGGRRVRSTCIKLLFSSSKAVRKLFTSGGWETRLIFGRYKVGLRDYGDGMDEKTAVVPFLVLMVVGHWLVFNTSSLLSRILLCCQASAAQSLRQRILLLANT